MTISPLLLRYMKRLEIQENKKNNKTHNTYCMQNVLLLRLTVIKIKKKSFPMTSSETTETGLTSPCMQTVFQNTKTNIILIHILLHKLL